MNYFAGAIEVGDRLNPKKKGNTNWALGRRRIYDFYTRGGRLLITNHLDQLANVAAFVLRLIECQRLLLARLAAVLLVGAAFDLHVGGLAEIKF